MQIEHPCAKLFYRSISRHIPQLCAKFEIQKRHFRWESNAKHSQNPAFLIHVSDYCTKITLKNSILLPNKATCAKIFCQSILGHIAQFCAKFEIQKRHFRWETSAKCSQNPAFLMLESDWLEGRSPVEGIIFKVFLL